MPNVAAVTPTHPGSACRSWLGPLPPLELNRLWVDALQQLRSLGQCSHRDLPLYEGKVVCPSCQRACLRQWVLLRCSGCGYKQVATLNAQQQVVAQTACCQHCGGTEYEPQILRDPPAHDLPFVTLSIEPLSSPATEGREPLTETALLVALAERQPLSPIALLPSSSA